MLSPLQYISFLSLLQTCLTTLFWLFIPCFLPFLWFSIVMRLRIDLILFHHHLLRSHFNHQLVLLLTYNNAYIMFVRKLKLFYKLIIINPNEINEGKIECILIYFCGVSSGLIIYLGLWNPHARRESA